MESESGFSQSTSTSVSKEFVDLNNLHKRPKEIRHTRELLQVLVKEEEISHNLPWAASINNRVTNASMIKLESEWNQSEIAKFSIDASIYDPNRLGNTLNLKLKSEPPKNYEECLLDQSLKPLLYGSNNFFPEQMEVPVKIEHCETKNEIKQVPEIFLNEWKIKSEEIELKDEDFEQNQMIISPSDTTQESFDEREYNFQMTKGTNLTKHFFEHNNVEETDTFKCNECNFTTIHKYNLVTHLLRHEIREELNSLKRDQLYYQTLQKGYVKKHIMQPKDLKEVETLRCDKCSFKTIYKCWLERHFVRHGNPKPDHLLKCNQCYYQTPYTGVLKVHLFKHKAMEDVDMINCNQCGIKANKKIHQLHHKRSKDLLRIDKYFKPKKPEKKIEKPLRRKSVKGPKEVFKCDKCEYSSVRQDQVIRHGLIHKSKDEVVTYNCSQCDFKSIYKFRLKTHLLRHEDFEKVSVFKCDQCEYKTYLKTHLNRHSLRHKNIEDEVDTFDCDYCSYKTVNRINLKRHLKRHQPKDDFKCDTCVETTCKN